VGGRKLVNITLCFKFLLRFYQFLSIQELAGLHRHKKQTDKCQKNKSSDKNACKDVTKNQLQKRINYHEHQ
jgi:hypothetical protein